MINLLTNRADALAALDLLEGDGFSRQSEFWGGPNGLSAADLALEKAAGSPPLYRGVSIFTLYGAGGWHRYYLYPSGEMRFSSGHNESSNDRG